jgi:diaminohydroxyphosphoribosylaminopyrimidine deaminase/5-amino-6-(5-phosphoribosylamino)uracil reductase
MNAGADDQWMCRALEVAERGRGHVEPNPLVGAVVVRDGQQVGEGWHEGYGAAHAEVNALGAAGAAANGATLFVTLEPCCHHGKTPPCSEAILRAGVRRVVAAMADPFPQVSGQGIARLRSAGIEVEVGLCETEARRLNAPYLKLLSTGRPYVHAKWAMTLDGKIASRSGDSKWISSEPSREKAHELRGRMDAIVVGIGTVLADDPRLTARPPGPRTATRIVLDSRLQLPSGSRLATTAGEAPVLIVTGKEIEATRQAKLAALGCEIVSLGMEQTRPAVPALLDELGRRRMTNILVEGGSEVLGSFLDAGAIDEVHVFIAPRLAGGSQAKSPVGGTGFEQIPQSLTLANWQIERTGSDVYLHGWR